MCERFTVPDRVLAEREFMPRHSWWNFSAKFNVAPTQYVPAIRQHTGESEGVMMRWGLIPSWTQKLPVAPENVSAECSQLEQDKAFKGAWLGSRRCILPVSGFYVWQLTHGKYRQPYFVRLIERPVFGLAAVWDRWVGEDDDVIESCCPISVPANKLMAGIANTDRRMPAILRRCDYPRWLLGTPEAVKGALRPYEARRMQAYAVSPRINCAIYDDQGLTQPSSMRSL
jgi:putative SOS response-associated peptidase YedK